jgi:hypothetical protein
MSTPEMQATIDRYALCYQKLTGFKLPHTGVFDHRSHAWFTFIKAGYTLQDLETVLVWLNGKIRKAERNTGAIRFSNLIERPDLFGEELNMARAETRNAKPAITSREQVLQQARPVVAEPTKPVQSSAKPISFWIEKMREAAK